MAEYPERLLIYNAGRGSKYLPFLSLSPFSWLGVVWSKAHG